ncbi:senescence-specific cysteine protease SAG39-like protein [Tanacetum coccineum]
MRLLWGITSSKHIITREHNVQHDPPKLVEVIKVTTGDFNNPVSFHEDDLPKGALQKLIRIEFLSTMSFMCLRRDRIGSLKVKIFRQEGIAPFMQKLFFAGVELDNHRTFSDYNIPYRSIIDLVTFSSLVYGQSATPTPKWELLDYGSWMRTHTTRSV